MLSVESGGDPFYKPSTETGVERTWMQGSLGYIVNSKLENKIWMWIYSLKGWFLDFILVQGAQCELVGRVE